MLSWDRLRVFAAVAELGSIAAAAEALHITGPGVSQHIRKLEREARCQLVEPDGRGVRLTAAGHLLASSAKSLAATVADAERDLANLGGQIAGPLRIGSVASAIRSLLPDVLRALLTAHPRLQPTLRDGDLVELIPLLRARRLDVVVLDNWTARPAAVPPGIRLTPLLTEEVRLAVAESHPLADRASVAIGELTDQVWTSCLPGTDHAEALLQVLRAHNVDPDVRYSVYDFATQLTLVAADLAVALIPRGARTPVPGVRFVPCVPTVDRSLVAAMLAAGDTPAVRAFVAELARVAREEPPGWPVPVPVPPAAPRRPS
ncbi:MAG TPA: LysR family transcriptional regulator [Pseudonocardia sp.]|jgi:DNA-binding transcriptional LysR family regulator|nr:LysR family transcriptional regulator [Pseudonocardia sp.]